MILSTCFIVAVLQASLQYAMGIRLKENYDIERMPRCDSFNLFYCGSIAGKPAICDGYKVERKL